MLGPPEVHGELEIPLELLPLEVVHKLVSVRGLHRVKVTLPEIWILTSTIENEEGQSAATLEFRSYGIEIEEM